MAVYWPIPGFKGRTFKLCVFNRRDFNFCVRSFQLRDVKFDMVKNLIWCATGVTQGWSQIPNLIFKASIHMDLLHFTNTNQSVNVKVRHLLQFTCNKQLLFEHEHNSILSHFSKTGFSILFSTNRWCLCCLPTRSYSDYTPQEVEKKKKKTSGHTLM